MGCNMRCAHCGSSCSDALPDQLSLDEAYKLIDELADLGLKWMTLSGGEPLTHKNWKQIATRLYEKGIETNMITNGSLITPEIAKSIAECHLSTVAISVDGTKEVHDKIRKPGSFELLENAFALLRQHDVFLGAITTVTKDNIDILPQIKDELIHMGVNVWQLQFGLPMGNMAQIREKVIDPEQIDYLLDFCYRTGLEGKIKIYPSDCIGYYSHKEIASRQIAFNTSTPTLWDGCNAGIRSLGILHNGDVLGCTSIRDREFIEGNIREQSLRSIWEDENKFSWSRKFEKDELKGICGTCKYSAKCLGGCANVRLTIGGDIYTDNKYCSYNVALSKNLENISRRTDCENLFAEAQDALEQREFQFAAQLFNRILEMHPDHLKTLKLLGYAEFFSGNPKASQAANERALKISPDDTYARSGFAMAVAMQGKIHEGIKIMEEVVNDTNYQNTNYVYDLMSLRNMLGTSNG